MNQRQAGFTIIELVLVVSIAIILLSAGIPSFQRISIQNKLATEANNFLASLNFARSESIKQSRRITLCKSANPTAATPACVTTGSWSQGWIVFIDNDADSIVDAGETVLQIQQALNGQITITGDSNAADSLTYIPNGTATGNGGGQTSVIQLCHSTYGRALSINNIGRASVTKVTCS